MQKERIVKKRNTIHNISRKEVVARILLLLCALGAVASFGIGFGDVFGDGQEDTALIAGIWQLYGYLVFAGLFVLLAYFPRRYTGVWELVLIHKVAVAASLPMAAGPVTPDMQTVAVTDGILAVMVTAAYLLTKGYAGWRTLFNPIK